MDRQEPVSLYFQLNMLTHFDLIKMIQSAWTDATPPLPGNISKPTYDDEGVSEYFAGKPWRGLSAAQLRRLDFAPNIFTDDAFAYYLPAYMIADIEEPEVSDTNIERVLFWLSENRGPAVVSRLNEMQLSAMRAYIEFIQARELDLYNDQCTRILRFIDDADKHG
jgi:hypothetical protein